ncbi:MAG: dienelactone hydrolase family protein [Gammaproteobacteria bacterium]|nr:dienelactone hydrolase family protein [Gammaproteobacteria bacterium]
MGHASRRQFNRMTAGASAALLLPGIAGAAALKEAEVRIATPDGTADAFFVHPSRGRHPAVLVWPDIRGLRPAFRQMGRRLAEAGYAVLVVNPFYRTKPAPTAPPNADLANEETRKALFALLGTLNATTHVTDAKAFVAWLDRQRVVDKKRPMATIGYCMGGPITMRAAAALPERIGAAASFHGGGLVTDKPDSPHLLVPRMRAHYLIAIAADDDQKAPQDKDVLRAAFLGAGLPAEIEVYADTRHGWCPPDSPVYHEAQAERAWSRMLALFERALA